MNNYLKGYLASIPKSEYDSLVGFLKNNISDKLNISEKQFELLLSQIVADKQPATQSRDINPKEKPSDTYNDFFSYVHIDLSYLFKVVDILYNALDGFSNLSASYLSDIKSEIDKLEIVIKELKAKVDYSSNAVVVTETFKNTEYFEVYNDSTNYLFCDRDGSQLPLVDLVHNNTDDMIALNPIKDIDLLHSKAGKPLGRVEVMDYRGIPSDTYSGRSNAIDNSNTSYWDCTVLSYEPIDMALENYEAGGAYLKFRVRLPAIYEITEVSLTPYCIYPVEICDIIVGNTSILNRGQSSTDTITARSAKISSDEIIFVLRQKNYTHSVEKTNKKLAEAEELWNSILEKEKESYTSTINKKTEAEIYRHYMAKNEEEVAVWNDDFIKQREIGE